MLAIVVIVGLSAAIFHVGREAVGKFPDQGGLETIKSQLKTRYVTTRLVGTQQEDDPKGYEPLVNYLERIIDRQINKARGILPFNSVIIAALGIEHSHLTPPLEIVGLSVNLMLWYVIALLVISSALCLHLFLVVWGPSYDFQGEVAHTASLILSRSKTIECATILSLASLAIGAVLIAFIVFARG
jgi:hypothetical protein